MNYRKTTFVLYMLPVAIMLCLASCSKENPLLANDGPTLTITSPAQMQTFDSVIHITGVAQAPSKDDAHLLHELSLTVKRTSDNATVWTSYTSVHEYYTYNIDTTLVIPHTGAAVNYVLNAQVVNHVLKYGTQNVNFTVNP